MEAKITCNNLICYTEKLQFEHRIKKLEEEIEKILDLPNVTKKLETTFEKKKRIIYFPEVFYQELHKLIKEK